MIPSLLLVAVSQRAMQQSRELGGKRRSDSQRTAKERIARELLERLDALKRQAGKAQGQADPGLAFTAAVDSSGRLVPPWESDAALRRFRELSSNAAFAAAISRAEQAEFARRGPETAALLYKEAAAVSHDPALAAYARLMMARVQRESRPAEALAEARRLLRVSTEYVDEDGVPLRVHAAALLASSLPDRTAVREALDSLTESRRWPSPAATFSLANLADQFETAPSEGDAAWLRYFRARISDAVRLQEQFESLQNDAARMQLFQKRKGDGRPSWIYYPGPEPWFLGTTAADHGSTQVVAARARNLLRPFEAAGYVRFLSSTDPGGEMLSDSFPGLNILFAAAGEPAEVPQILYYLALFALLSAAAFGAFLLWRSLQQEMRLAETRAQFVSSVSHELKTPLTSIRMFAETLQMGRVRDQALQDEYLETIVNECERLSRLVDDVLMFSKIEQGKKVFHFRPVPLAETVRAAARTLAYPMAQNGFDLRLEVEEGLPAVKADSDALEQAVLNLLTNAMKYSGDRREIALRLGRRNGEAVIEVTDHGIGIPPEEQARIFEKYYRVASRENQSIPGTGLGLTLVAQIVKAHNGRVDIRSAPGEGSTFSIRLPIGNGS